MVEITPVTPDFMDVVSHSWALFAALGGLTSLILGVNVGAFIVDALVEYGVRPLADL